MEKHLKKNPKAVQEFVLGSDHPDLKSIRKSYRKLKAMIADLNAHNDAYRLILNVVKRRSPIEAPATAERLESLMEKLSKREMQIFELAMKGFTNREISEALFIAVDTVKTHRKKIVGKAGVSKIEDIKDWLISGKFLDQ